jgi:hypothetical protein
MAQREGAKDFKLSLGEQVMGGFRRLTDQVFGHGARKR